MGALFTITLVQITNTMDRSEVVPGAMVKFRWNKNPQRNLEVQRRAMALDGQLVEIMAKPFWTNGKRAQIRSPIDSNLTLGVKWKYLLMINSAPLSIHLFLAPEDTYDGSLMEVEAKLVRWELEIANNPEYAAVCMSHPDTLSRCTGANRWKKKLSVLELCVW